MLVFLSNFQCLIYCNNLVFINNIGNIENQVKNFLLQRDFFYAQNLRRDKNYVTIAEINRWRDRLFEAIDRGSVYRADGTWVELTEENAVDIIGNLIESSILSLNPGYYGSLHNKLHMLLAHVHDPDFRFKVSNGKIDRLVNCIRLLKTMIFIVPLVL